MVNMICINSFTRTKTAEKVKKGEEIEVSDKVYGKLVDKPYFAIKKPDEMTAEEIKMLGEKMGLKGTKKEILNKIKKSFL